MTAEPPFRIAQAGIGLVPEGRQIFPTLTVEENLVATAANRSSAGNGWTLERVYALLPAPGRAPPQLRRPDLGRRAADAGDRPRPDDQPQAADPGRGHRRAGAADPRRRSGSASRRLKREGLSILIIDKNVEALLRLSDRHLILEKGRIVWSGTSRALAADPVTRDRYLSV